MGQFPVPKLKDPIDVVPTLLPLPLTLIGFAFVCVLLLLATLAYASYLQLQKVDISLAESLALCMFGFLLPSLNLYMISRSMPSGREMLLLNLTGVCLSLWLFLAGPESPLDMQIKTASPLLAIVIASAAILYRHRKTAGYYRAVKTGVIEDLRLWQPVIDPVITRRMSGIMYTLLEALFFVGTIVAAVLVIAASML